MASAVLATVATIVIFVLFKGGGRRVVIRGDFGMDIMIACNGYIPLPGMNMHAIDRNSQHDQQKQHR